MPPLNLLDLIASLPAQQPAPGVSVDPAPPAPGTVVTPGGGGDQSSPLGTVLATLRRIGPGPRTRAALGAGLNQKVAPSRGGAIAQGIMQAMEGASTYDTEQAKLQRLLDAFDYQKSKDKLDREYREKQDAIKNRQAEDRLKIWGKSIKGKPSSVDPLTLETRRTKLLSQDPDFKRLTADDEAPDWQKMQPDARKALEEKVAARKAAIWKLGATADDDEEEPDAPAKARATPDPTGLAIPIPLPRQSETAPPPAPATESSPPTPANVPLPIPRPADLGGGPAAPVAKPAPAAPIQEMTVDPNGGATVAGAQEPPPIPGARLAPDGNWYVQQNGRYFKVER